MNKSLNLPLNFYLDVDTALNITPKRYGLNFFKELEEISKIIDRSQIHISNFEELEDVLKKWKLKTIEDVSILLEEKVCDEDPIYCPISLFESMDYGRLETAHTRTLTWLLNPKEKHGFGDALIKELILEKFKYEIGDVFEVDSEMAVRRLSDYAGSGRLDIFAQGISKDKSEKWVLAIEAKIDAEESEDQLHDYDQWLEETFSDHKLMRIFLTPDKRKGTTSHTDWETCSYFEIAIIFSDVAKRNSFSKKHNDSYPFLRYYIAGLLKDLSGFKLPIDRKDWREKSNFFKLHKYLLRKK
jgi:hypothetical protein